MSYHAGDRVSHYSRRSFWCLLSTVTAEASESRSGLSRSTPDLAAALSSARRAVELSGTPLFIWNLGFAHAAAGNGAEAIELIGELEQMSSETFVDPDSSGSSAA